MLLHPFTILYGDVNLLLSSVNGYSVLGASAHTMSATTMWSLQWNSTTTLWIEPSRRHL